MSPGKLLNQLHSANTLQDLVDNDCQRSLVCDYRCSAENCSLQFQTVTMPLILLDPLPEYFFINIQRALSGLSPKK